MTKLKLKLKSGCCLSCGKLYFYDRGDGNSRIKCASCYFRDHCRRVKIKACLYLGDKCTLCGYNDAITAMVFHHTDPDQKDFEISQFKHKRWALVREELDKCDLLCANCHQELHWLEGKGQKLIELLKQPPLSINGSDGDINCVICDKFLPKTSTMGRKRAGLCSTCKQRKWALSIKLKCLDYLGNKCLACGYDKCPGALSFHHRDGQLKLFEISQAKTSDWDVLQTELDKCELLCFNCHQELHGKF